MAANESKGAAPVGGVDFLAIIADAPSVTVGGVTAPHNLVKWRVCTNRHRGTDGRCWGWIEGAPGNVCWSNSEAFNESRARDMVSAHNQWLEDQKPLSIRLVEAREAYSKASNAFDAANTAYQNARNGLKEAEERLAALSHATGAAS